MERSFILGYYQGMHTVGRWWGFKKGITFVFLHDRREPGSYSFFHLFPLHFLLQPDRTKNETQYF
jgi:hypothetical protein